MKFLIRIRKTFMLCVKIMIVSAITVGFIHTWISNYVESLFSNRGNYVVILAYVLIFTTLCKLYGAFNIGVYRIHEIIYSFSLSIVFTNIVMYMILSLIARQMVAVSPLALGTLIQILMVSLCSVCANTIYFKLHPARRVVAVFGDDITGFQLIKKMSCLPERFIIECGINAEHTDMEQIKPQIDKYDAVVICGIDKNVQKKIISYC